MFWPGVDTWKKRNRQWGEKRVIVEVSEWEPLVKRSRARWSQTTEGTTPHFPVGYTSETACKHRISVMKSFMMGCDFTQPKLFALKQRAFTTRAGGVSYRPTLRESFDKLAPPTRFREGLQSRPAVDMWYYNVYSYSTCKHPPIFSNNIHKYDRRTITPCLGKVKIGE